MRKSRRLPKIPDPSRFDRLPPDLVVMAAETAVSEAVRLLRDEKQLDEEFMLAQAEAKLEEALMAVRSCRRRVALLNTMH